MIVKYLKISSYCIRKLPLFWSADFSGFLLLGLHFVNSQETFFQIQISPCLPRVSWVTVCEEQRLNSVKHGLCSSERTGSGYFVELKRRLNLCSFELLILCVLLLFSSCANWMFYHPFLPLQTQWATKTTAFTSEQLYFK